MSEDYQSLTVEESQPTTGIDETAVQADEQGIDNEAIQEEATGVQENTSKLVPLEVVEAMREQQKELKAHNEQLLQLMLSNQRQQQQQEQPRQQEEQFQIADDEFLTGAQLKAILARQEHALSQQTQAFQAQQRETYIAEQKQQYISQYPDYNDVINSVQAESQRDPAIAELIMKTKNPVETAYKFGKVLRGETLGEVKTVKAKVSQENKIQQNLTQPKTLSNVKGAAVIEKENFNPEERFLQRLGH